MPSSTGADSIRTSRSCTSNPPCISPTATTARSAEPMLAFTSIGPGATNTVVGMATVLRRLDRGRAVHRLAAHLHARRTGCSRSSSAATSPTTRGSSSPSSRSGGSRRGSTSCRSSSTAPGTRCAPDGPGRSSWTCRWTSRPKRASVVAPRPRRARGARPAPAGCHGRRGGSAAPGGRKAAGDRRRRRGHRLGGIGGARGAGRTARCAGR